jgi:glutathione synthase
LRANLAQFASAERTRLTAPQTALVAKIQQELVDKRIGFAAIDSVGEYLMEVNVANPGGLGTLNHLYQKDFGAAVVEAVEGFI